MDSSIVLSVVAAIITLIAIGLFLYQSRPKKTEKPTQEETQEQPHKYLTPAALSGNSEWQTLIEDWRSLSKMKSWTPEYSRAEEAYRLKFRRFLQTDLNEPNILRIPIVALELQCAEVYIGHYHTRHGDLDFSKGLDDRRHITHVMFDSNVPEEVKAAILKIHDVANSVEDQGVDAAMKRLKEVKSELQAKYESTPTEQFKQPEE